MSSTHRGKKAPLKSFSSYCTTRIRCSGVADGTAGPDRAGENSPRTLRAEGEGGRKGDRSLERRGRGMGRARQEDAGERERERPGEREGPREKRPGEVKQTKGDIQVTKQRRPGGAQQRRGKVTTATPCRTTRAAQDAQK